MFAVFNTLGVGSQLSAYSVSGGGTTTNWREAAFGVRWDLSSVFYGFMRRTMTGATGTVSISSYGEGPINFTHIPINSGFAYAGALRMRARQGATTGGVTPEGTFNVWMPPANLSTDDRIWGCYSTNGATGSLVVNLDFALEGNLNAYKTYVITTQLL